MQAAGRSGVLLGLILISSLFAWTASSNSAGAPQNAADTGCTCHNGAADTGVTVGVQGLPEAYQPEATYDVTITVTGGPTPIPAVSQNQGGFAMKVSAGTLLAEDGITVTGGKSATHSADTNNQRSWALQWVAPAAGSGAVNVSVAVNSVNGDGTSGGGFDRWNRATFVIAPASGGTGGNTTQSPSATPTDGSSPGVPFVVGALIVVAIVAWRRRHG